MKARTGFVSNSSSSSFVVRRRLRSFMSNDDKEKILLSDDQLKLLLEAGFKFTWSQLECILWDNWSSKGDGDDKVPVYDDSINVIGERPVTEDDFDCLGYYVICNEDEVVQFLLENSISFRGLLTYGTKGIIYDADKNLVVLASNFGTELTMYGLDFDEYAFKKKKLVKGTRENWLNNKLRL